MTDTNGNLLKRYIFWTYDRGSFHYDVMVTLILLFLFVAPHFVDFHDRPANNVPLHASEVLVRETGSTGSVARFVYEIRAEDLKGARTEAQVRQAILNVIQPVSGEVTLQDYKPLTDAKGNVIAYQATATR